MKERWAVLWGSAALALLPKGVENEGGGETEGKTAERNRSFQSHVSLSSTDYVLCLTQGIKEEGLRTRA